MRVRARTWIDVSLELIHYLPINSMLRFTRWQANVLKNQAAETKTSGDLPDEEADGRESRHSGGSASAALVTSVRTATTTLAALGTSVVAPNAHRPPSLVGHAVDDWLVRWAPALPTI